MSRARYVPTKGSIFSAAAYEKVLGDPFATEGLLKTAGAITPDDISSIEAVTILQELLGGARPQFTLEQTMRPIRMSNLTQRIDIKTKLAGQKAVPPMVEADIVSEAYTAVNFDLPKNVVHVVVADESQMKAAHDIMGSNIADASRELAEMRNEDIATVLDGVTEIAGSNWSTVTDGRSANNPFADYDQANDVIEGTNGYPIDIMMAHPRVWGVFFGNDYVKGQLAGATRPAGKIFDVPGLPGVTGYSDYGLPTTSAFYASRAAPWGVFGEGPVEAARYRNEAAGYYAYIVRDWHQPKIVLSGAIRELTGVRA